MRPSSRNHLTACFTTAGSLRLLLGTTTHADVIFKPEPLFCWVSRFVSLLFGPPLVFASPPDAASLLCISPNPHLHSCSGIYSQMHFSFGVYLFSGAAPCRSAPPLLGFLLEVSTMTNSRLAGIYSAPVLGVMWADRPLLLAWLTLPPDGWGPVGSSAPSLFNVKNRTFLFFPKGQMNIPLGYNFTVLNLKTILVKNHTSLQNALKQTNTTLIWDHLALVQLEKDLYCMSSSDVTLTLLFP